MKDTSGAVLPGVTVEATSPALIEKVRTAVTDGEGRYNIVDLRPGAYVVSFSLAGFSTLKREGIELSAGFTATVNADMKVGTLEETITVTGATPLVDTQNVRQQKTVSNQLLSTLPVGQATLTLIVALTPGLSGASDVGGTRGTFRGIGQNDNRYHGKAGGMVKYDGMRIQNPSSFGQSPGYLYNVQTVQEFQVETGAASAETGSTGVVTNLIPKEGSNSFRFTATGLFGHRRLQSDNLTDELRARGLASVPKLLNVWDTGGTVAGPIRKDKLWFITGFRGWGSNTEITVYKNKTQGTLFYTPDFDRFGDSREYNRAPMGRLTWQVSPKNKVNLFADIQKDCQCNATGPTLTNAWESTLVRYLWPTGIVQGSWNSTATSHLLLEAGAAAVLLHWPSTQQAGVSRDDVSILEQSTNFRYGAPTSTAPERQIADRYVQRFALSYVTGSHAFKAGLQTEQTFLESVFEEGGRPEARGVSYTFLNQKPVSLTMRAWPLDNKYGLKADVGIYAQDQWTIKQLTMNTGLRFEYINGRIPEHHLPAGQFVPVRDFAAVHGAPDWKDVYPRLGVSYDLFGTGRTALKLSLGRYGEQIGTNVTGDNDPLTTSVGTVNRSWNDNFYPVGDPRRGNYVPDCDLANPALNGECGPFLDQNFGKNNPNANRWADDALRGFGVRGYLWEVATEVQHQLGSQLSVTGGYYRNWSGNFRVTDNLAVSPADYSPFCITAPVDARLPGGGGYQVCGLYNLNPGKVGQVNNLVTQASNYAGTNSHLNCGTADFVSNVSCGISNFFSLTMDARFAQGTRLGGGVDIGRTVIDNCVVIDSPQDLLNCRTVPPWSAGLQVKMNGSYALPRGFSVNGTFQNVSGPPYTGNYAVTNDQVAPSLGRNLSGGLRSVTVPLIAPRSQYEKRRTQVDMRLSKGFKVGPTGRLQANFDIYNVTNAGSIINVANTYGSRWRQPTEILPGRLIQIGGELTF